MKVIAVAVYEHVLAEVSDVKVEMAKASCGALICLEREYHGAVVVRRTNDGDDF